MPKKLKQIVTFHIHLEDNVKSFVVRYLNPVGKLSKLADANLHSSFERMAQAAAELEDWSVIADMVQRQDHYSYFRKTVYWRLVAAKVKERDNRTCVECGYQGRHVECDHKTYADHGSEHLHLEDLQTLCSRCHSMKHEDMIGAIIAENLMYPTNDRLADLFSDVELPDPEQLDALSPGSQDWNGDHTEELHEEKRRGTEERPGDSR